MTITRPQTQNNASNIAWLFMLLASALPIIVIREVIHTDIPETWRLGMVEWLVYTQIGNMPLWRAWQSDSSFNISMIASQTLKGAFGSLISGFVIAGVVTFISAVVA